MSNEHEVLQETPSAHVNPPGQENGVHEVQLPAPSHVPAGMKTPLAHEAAPHEVLPIGYAHAPVVSQSVAPQAPVVVHVAAQQ